MSPLWLYAVFHINLAFSSIPKSHFPLILDRCYWPLLEVAKRMNVPFAFEAPGYSLEILNQLDSSFIQALKSGWENNQIEFVGAGYSQSILPLIPAEVNRENLRIGNEVYRDLLGRAPRTAYVNEQTYSSGVVDLYKEAGYRQIVMEWNNPARFHHYPAGTRYRPQQILNPDGSDSITVVWNDSISFQKLQRVLAQSLSEDDYMTFLDRHRHSLPQNGGGLAFYGSDAEIMDYHPGHLEAEYLASHSSDDIQRLVKLIERLQTLPDVQWTTPSGLVEKFPPEAPPIRLESPEYPLPCKKQPKYNPTRWAVTGREDTHLNAQCFERYQQLNALRTLKPELEKTLPWRYLLESWGSDFRTHTTDEKVQQVRQRAGSLERYVQHQMGQLVAEHPTSPNQVALWNPNPETYDDILTLDLQFPPRALHGYPSLEAHPAITDWQLEGVGYYQDGSVRWAKCVLACKLPGHALTTLHWVSGEKPNPLANGVSIDTQNQLTRIQTDAVLLQLNLKRGGAVDALQFSQLDQQPWVGTLPHGTFDDIALSADFYSGHFILSSKRGEKATDLNPGTLQLPENPGDYPVRLPIQVGISTEIGNLWKTFYIYRHQPRIDMLYHFKFRDVAAASAKVGIATILPEAFDLDSLAYRTVNGGLSAERFTLKGHRVVHSEPVSVTVSAQQGLGATQGWVAVEDQRNRFIMRTYPQAAYAMPMIHFEESAPGYFLRILPSIGEFDDTSHQLWRGHHQVMFSWQGQHASDDVKTFLPPVSLSPHAKVLPL